MTSSFRFARQIPLRWPALAAVVTQQTTTSSSQSSSCDAAQQQETPLPPVPPPYAKKPAPAFGMFPDEKGDFHNLFPKRQLWQPKVEYPLWDPNWDARVAPSTGSPEEDQKRMRHIRKTGVTRHIILVRHGQYHETEKEDHKRVLTELGRQQADITGKRLREMLEGASKEFGPCNLKVVRVSNMARAKETADIIAAHLPGVERSEPDPGLNEGRPSHTIPGGKASAGTVQKTDENHARIEDSFQRYFYRADMPEENEEDVENSDKSKHEFEVIVCHANIIRYFLCR
jgi:serine/threonine-protein phosphatase PGAM5